MSHFQTFDVSQCHSLVKNGYETMFSFTFWPECVQNIISCCLLWTEELTNRIHALETSVFHSAVLLLMINFLITLSK